MNNATLGRLQRVELRAVWLSESGNFTPWLAQEENLLLLADTIGLDLDLEATEKFVGPFRADIVCKDTISNSWVLIENQLERTDHSHLGQLLTYAAGLDAVTIVWIAERFTDEHRAALDWLNEVTAEQINFFGLEVELWRIGNSAIAPKFNVISQPNDWTRTVAASRQAEGGPVTETKQLQLEYWTAFLEFLRQEKSAIKLQKPLPQHWAVVAIGRSGFHLQALSGMRDKFIAVQLIISAANAKAYYRLLEQERNLIEAEVGEVLEWRELPNNKQSQISLFRRDTDPIDRTQWSLQHRWLQERIEAFYKAFSSRIKMLNLSFVAPVMPDSLVDEQNEQHLVD